MGSNRHSSARSFQRLQMISSSILVFGSPLVSHLAVGTKRSGSYDPHCQVSTQRLRMGGSPRAKGNPISFPRHFSFLDSGSYLHSSLWWGLKTLSSELNQRLERRRPWNPKERIVGSRPWTRLPRNSGLTVILRPSRPGSFPFKPLVPAHVTDLYGGNLSTA